MAQGGVLDYEDKAAVAAKGYFPEDMPIEDYPDDFIKGVLIGAWRQVHEWIERTGRPCRFNFTLQGECRSRHPPYLSNQKGA